MEVEKGLQFEKQIDKESLGHVIERGVAEFLDSGVFECVDGVEKTVRNGNNDKKGIDVIVRFSDGSKIAIDVTTGSIGSVTAKKLESMQRSPMTFVLEERNEEGDIIVEKTIDVVPRAIISVESKDWEVYCDEVDDLNHTILLHMSEDSEAREKEAIITKLLVQIETFSKRDINYKKKTEKIREALEQELEEIKI